MKKQRRARLTSLAVVTAAVGALILPSAAAGGAIASGPWACDYPDVVCHTPK